MYASKFFNNLRANINALALCFLEIDILSRESFEGFYRLDHVFFLWKRHLPSQKRGLCHPQAEGGWCLSLHYPLWKPFIFPSHSAFFPGRDWGNPLPWWKGIVDLLVGDLMWHKSSLSVFRWWWWRSLWMRCILFIHLRHFETKPFATRMFLRKVHSTLSKVFSISSLMTTFLIFLSHSHLWVRLPWGMHQEFVAPQQMLFVAPLLRRGEPF